MNAPPFVLVFSALDGTCGAGVVSDCRAIASAGAIPLAIATGIAAQNLNGVLDFWRFPPSRIQTQMCALQNAKIAACKIGAIGTESAVLAIAKIVATLPADSWTVWDPVLSPTGGAPFADSKTMNRMRKILLPRADIITPNRRELSLLSGRRKVEDGAKTLLDGGAKMILATDICAGDKVRHALYSADGELWTAECFRRRGEYHGGGCFFSATLAARLAAGDSPVVAAEFANRATLSAIDNALRLPSLGAQYLLRPAAPRKI